MDTIDLELPPQLAGFTPPGNFSRGPVFSRFEELDHANFHTETAVFTTGAEVILADHALLQHDFPCLSDERLEMRHPELKVLEGEVRKMVIRQRIEEWLLRQCCFVSENQASQARVNTKIPVSGEQVPVYRPLLYGRATIISLKHNRDALGWPADPGFEDEDGLLDVKGTGLAPGIEPRYYNHGNGLLSLEEAFREYLNQQLTQAIFRHSTSKFETLPTYAVIRLPFDLQVVDETNMGPAALLVRRAHQRPLNPGGLPVYQTDMQLVQLEAELLLRHYGVTSCNYVTGVKVSKHDGVFQVRYGEHEVRHLNEDQMKNLEEVSQIKDKSLYFEGVNIQHTRDFTLNPPHLTIIDFGSFEVRDRFTDPILSLVSDRLLHWGGSIWPHFPNYPQPVDSIRVPFDIWGDNTHFWGFEVGLKKSKQSTLCYGLARHLQNGTLTRLDAANILHAFLSTATGRIG
ncbi:MAG: hypothetical protein H6581_12030 [Bacteroidia bacterium]|nr:hypothetical protein [Bacteroidia bacterium]